MDVRHHVPVYESIRFRSRYTFRNAYGNAFVNEVYHWLSLRVGRHQLYGSYNENQTNHNVSRQTHILRRCSCYSIIFLLHLLSCLLLQFIASNGIHILKSIQIITNQCSHHKRTQKTGDFARFTNIQTFSARPLNLSTFSYFLYTFQREKVYCVGFFLVFQLLRSKLSMLHNLIRHSQRLISNFLN